MGVFAALSILYYSKILSSLLQPFHTQACQLLASLNVHEHAACVLDSSGTCLVVSDCIWVCCAESHVLYSRDVLSSLLQLALLILKVCSSAQRSLQAWLDANQPHRLSATGAVTDDMHEAATAAQTLQQQQQQPGNVEAPPEDSISAEVIDLTADSDNSQKSDEAAARLSQHAAHTQLHGIVEGANALLKSLEKAEGLQGQLPKEVAGSNLPPQAAGVKLPIQATALQQLSEHLPELVPKQEAGDANLPNQDASCEADSRTLPNQASGITSQQSPQQLPTEAVKMGSDAEEQCMLCAYGMDLAAVLGCLLEHMQDWPGVQCFPLLMVFMSSVLMLTAQHASTLQPTP